MRFELDNALMDEILFFMENQDNEFFLDTRDGRVICAENYKGDVAIAAQLPAPDFHNDDRFILLPEWSSNNGFRLMENFAASIKNPIVRQELSAALNRSKGVFRAFKDVLDQYPETEKLWYKFKEQKMKEEVIVWYNSLREEWGLKPIGTEPEDTTPLVLEDFSITETGDYSFSAETASGDSAGNISVNLDGTVLQIKTLEVKPEYRGMGIGKTLLSKVLSKADENNLDVSIDVPKETEFFTRSLLLENFEPVVQKFYRKK